MMPRRQNDAVQPARSVQKVMPDPPIVVSVIVPAYNEEEHLGDYLWALRGSPGHGHRQHRRRHCGTPGASISWGRELVSAALRARLKPSC